MLIRTKMESDSAVIWHNQAIDTALAIQKLECLQRMETMELRLVAEALFEELELLPASTIILGGDQSRASFCSNFVTGL